MGRIKIGEFIGGVFALVVGDYVLYVMIEAFAKTTPEWGTYGWGLFIAFNAAALFYIRHALKSERQVAKSNSGVFYSSSFIKVANPKNDLNQEKL